MNYTLLKEVHAQSQEWTVKVRVTRMSKLLSPHDPSKILKLGFVILDEESATMDAEIQQEWVPKFMPRLSENSVYYIKYFRVSQPRYSYNAVNRPIMARFTKYTTVHEVKPTPQEFPLYACNLISFEALKDRDGIKTYCSDILGVFTGCSHIRMQDTKGGLKPLRNVYLSDGSDSVPITLWGPQAEEFPADKCMEANDEPPQVFLFVGLTCHMFKSSVQLQSSSICKWYLNPSVPEADTLRARYLACNGHSTTPIWHGTAPSTPPLEKITVAELAKVDNPHTIYNNRYVIDVMIKCLKPNHPWWYHACTVCNKRATPQDDVYKCTGPNCTSTTGGPRYLLPVLATDPLRSLSTEDNPVIELVFFGPKAEELIGAPVHALIAAHAGTAAFLPTKITDLYGRKYQLRISLSPSSLDKENISHQVGAILGTVDTTTGSTSAFAGTSTTQMLPPLAQHTSVPALQPQAYAKPIETISQDTSATAKEDAPAASPSLHHQMTTKEDAHAISRQLEETAATQEPSETPSVTETAPAEKKDSLQAQHTTQSLLQLESTPPPQQAAPSLKQSTPKKRAKDNTELEPTNPNKRTKKKPMKKLAFDDSQETE